MIYFHCFYDEALRLFGGRHMYCKVNFSYALLAMIRKNRDGGRRQMLRSYILLRSKLSNVSRGYQ